MEDFDITALGAGLNTAGLEVWQLWVMLAIGVLLLVAGYKVKKAAFFIIWFILGYMLTSYFMPTLNSLVPEIASQELWQWLMPLCGGVLLALLGFSIEKVCLGGICFALVMAITVEYFGTEPQTLAIGAVVGVIAAGAAVTMMKPATVAATAIAGAYCVTMGVIHLTGIDGAVWYWPCMAGLSLIGSAIQFITTKKG